MRVRFTKQDPRRGTVVELDAVAAQRLIDSGAAEEVTGSKAATTEADKAEQAATPAPAPASVAAEAAVPAKRAAPAKKATHRSK